LRGDILAVANLRSNRVALKAFVQFVVNVAGKFRFPVKWGKIIPHFVLAERIGIKKHLHTSIQGDAV
jgi:hypothetical protein